MQTKHFSSDSTYLVNNALYSLTLTNPSLAFDRESRIIFRRPTSQDETNPKVSVVSGGGSGHEPAFAGFVGKGLLTASVAGTIFASPSAEQIRRAVTERVETEKGVLVIPMNYTGDVLNFGMAAAKAKAAGLKAEFFAIADDVGVGRKKGGKVGRRGIGGGILVLKIVGALAETGASLEDVYRIAQLTTENLASLGSSLDHAHVPGRDIPEGADIIPDGEAEIGMGIHNEPGSHRVKASLDQLVKQMLKQMLDQDDPDRGFLKYGPSDKFALLVNNLGGLSPLELSAVTAEVAIQLESDYKIKPLRVVQGTFLTSLNQPGFSLSLLRLADTGLGPGKSMLELLDTPSEAVGWSSPIPTSTWENRTDQPVAKRRAATEIQVVGNLTADPASFHKILISGLNRVIAAEPDVTRYDTIVGDGDCGVGLKRGAESIIKFLSMGTTNDDVINAVTQIIPVVENTMDGTSGAIYAIFLNSLAHGLREQDPKTIKPITATEWATALKYALDTLVTYTPAQPGDRTLVDALAPFVKSLVETGDITTAAAAAQKGSESTKDMKASLGRAVYVGGESEWLGKIPDPGAYGLSEFLAGLADAFR